MTYIILFSSKYYSKQGIAALGTKTEGNSGIDAACESIALISENFDKPMISTNCLYTLYKSLPESRVYRNPLQYFLQAQKKKIMISSS